MRTRCGQDAHNRPEEKAQNGRQAPTVGACRAPPSLRLRTGRRVAGRSPAPGAGSSPLPSAAALAAALHLAVVCESCAVCRPPEPCLLPVTLHVRNSSDAPLAFNFAAGAAAEPEGGQSAAAEGGGQYAWLGTTRLARHWLGPGQTAELKLHAAFAGVGAAVLEGLSVAVCGWRDAGGEPTWLDEPALCDGPPPCTVRVKPGL